MQAGSIQRVVIVDSDPVAVRGQQAVVEDYCASAMVNSYQTLREATGCLHSYCEVPIDLLLMDARLYRNGGKVLVREVTRRAVRWVYDPVIILTVAPAEAHNVNRAGPSAFVSDYLGKPVVPEFLQYLLEFHFEREGVNGIKATPAGPDAR